MREKIEYVYKNPKFNLGRCGWDKFSPNFRYYLGQIVLSFLVLSNIIIYSYK